MGDSIYSTFSTIAQVVAGICAVVTGLWMFRLQALEGELRERVDRINADETVDTMGLRRKDRVRHHVVDRDLGLRLKNVKYIDPLGSAYNYLRVKWMIWAISYGTKLVVFTLFLSLVTIVISIAVLAMVEHSMDVLIPHYFSSRTDLLDFGVALCAFALFFNGLTLFRVFRNE